MSARLRHHCINCFKKLGLEGDCWAGCQLHVLTANAIVTNCNVLTKIAVSIKVSWRADTAGREPSTISCSGLYTRRCSKVMQAAMKGEDAVISRGTLCAGSASDNVCRSAGAEGCCASCCAEEAGHELATDSISSSVTAAAPDSDTLRWPSKPAAAMSSST